MSFDIYAAKSHQVCRDSRQISINLFPACLCESELRLTCFGSHLIARCYLVLLAGELCKTEHHEVAEVRTQHHTDR
jgi:hypothetical protein